MKTFKWKRLGFLLATIGILTGNLIGIRALATEEGDGISVTGPDDPPEGVLVGYKPSSERVKTGEHYESVGWVGAPVLRVLVNDYTYVPCCRKTYRAMDGCKGLKKCEAES